jgi:hypothetical protein
VLSPRTAAQLILGFGAVRGFVVDGRRPVMGGGTTRWRRLGHGWQEGGGWCRRWGQTWTEA